MAQLRITRASGEVVTHPITPAIEYAFEQSKKKGFAKALIEDQLQSDIFWIAWEAIRRSGETVPVFGAAFVDTLTKVEVLDDEVPNA
jgi:hypothetical protein